MIILFVGIEAGSVGVHLISVLVPSRRSSCIVLGNLVCVVFARSRVRGSWMSYPAESPSYSSSLSLIDTRCGREQTGMDNEEQCILQLSRFEGDSVYNSRFDVTQRGMRALSWNMRPWMRRNGLNAQDAPWNSEGRE